MFRLKRSAVVLAAFSAAFCAVSFAIPFQETGASTGISLTTPLSITFVSSGEGWASSKCGVGACDHLLHTQNEGKTWSALVLPAPLRSWMNTDSSVSDFPQNQPHVYFANDMDGWIYGAKTSPGLGGSNSTKPELWATHDGGRTWSSVPTAPLALRFDVLEVSASNGWAYAIGWHGDNTFGLWRTPVASNNWQRVATPTLYSAAGGAAMQGALVFQGRGGWLMVGNDRGATGLARMTPSGSWVAWKGPCGPVGDSYAVPVALSPKNLLDVCTIGGYGEDVVSGTPSYLKLNTDWLFSSDNGGSTFSPVRKVGSGYTASLLGGESSATTSSGLIFVERSTPKTGVQRLQVSSNDAKSWTTLYSTTPSSYDPSFGPVAFTSRGLGSEIVLTSPETTSLLLSTNGGLRWVRSGS